jgi:hypothetical protein
MTSPRQHALSGRLPCRGTGNMSVDRGEHVGWVTRRCATAFLGLALALAASGTMAQGRGPLSDEPPTPTSDANRAPADRTKPPSHNVIADKPAWKQVTLGTYRGVHALRQALDAAGPLLIGGEVRADLSVHPQASFVFVRPQRIASPDLR